MLNLIFAAVLCTPVTEPFTGTMCSPNDGKRHAAVMLLGGSEGGDSMANLARLFASKGYVGASVAYFGMKGVPPTLVDVPVETVGHAIDALTKRDDVDGAHIGIIGGSKGGEFSLLAASTYPQIKAVVGFVPSPVAFMGLGTYDVPTGCSWSEGGKPLPCIPPNPVAIAKIGEEMAPGGSSKPVALRPLYDASIDANASVAKAAFFPLQRINGPVLCLAAADDQTWNSPRYCTMALDYLHAHHHAFADREIIYPNAGHTFLGAVHGPQSAVTQLNFGTSALAFGGTPEGDANAATAAWKTVFSFFATALK